MQLSYVETINHEVWKSALFETLIEVCISFLSAYVTYWVNDNDVAWYILVSYGEYLRLRSLPADNTATLSRVGVTRFNPTSELLVCHPDYQSQVA